MEALTDIINRLRKPLTYAARDGFAHVKSLSAMEPFVRAQAEVLKRMPDDLGLAAELERLFSGFDSLSAEDKKERILTAAGALDRLERRGNADVAVAAGSVRGRSRRRVRKGFGRSAAGRGRQFLLKPGHADSVLQGDRAEARRADEEAGHRDR
jgi:hypothetical protein